MASIHAKKDGGYEVRWSENGDGRSKSFPEEQAGEATDFYLEKDWAAKKKRPTDSTKPFYDWIDEELKRPAPERVVIEKAFPKIVFADGPCVERTLGEVWTGKDDDGVTMRVKMVAKNRGHWKHCVAVYRSLAAKHPDILLPILAQNDVGESRFAFAFAWPGERKSRYADEPDDDEFHLTEAAVQCEALRNASLYIRLHDEGLFGVRSAVGQVVLANAGPRAVGLEILGSCGICLLSLGRPRNSAVEVCASSEIASIGARIIEQLELLALRGGETSNALRAIAERAVGKGAMEPFLHLRRFEESLGELAQAEPRFESSVNHYSRIELRAFLKARLVRLLNNEVLSPLRRQTANGCNRLRVYTLDSKNLEFRGLCELGGTLGNFAVENLPILYDPLSVMALREQASLLHTRKPGSAFRDTLAWDIGGGARRVADRDSVAYDLPLIERADVERWIDALLISEGRLLGKIAIDGGEKSRTGEEPDVALADPEIRVGIQRATELLRFHGANRLPFPKWLVGRLEGAEQSKVFEECHRIETLENIVKATLATMKLDPDTGMRRSRVRFYLTISKHRALFPTYSELMLKTPPHEEIRGFLGKCEIGGTRHVFSDMFISSNLDIPSFILLGDNPGELDDDYAEIQRRANSGAPVIFTLDSKPSLGAMIPRCNVRRFYASKVLGKQKMCDHVDIPIVDSGEIVGKLSADFGSEISCVSQIKPHNAAPLMKYAAKIAAALKSPGISEVFSSESIAAIERLVEES